MKRSGKSFTALTIIFVVASSFVHAQKEVKHDTYEQMKFLVNLLGLIDENYVEDVNSQKLIYGAANGMVRTLDSFSQFLEPDMNRELKNETEGQFGGVGLRMNLREEWLTVLTPMPGTPAYRAGILPNDRIIEIDGQATREMDFDEALNHMRGAPGSKVKIKIQRTVEEASQKVIKTLDFELTRELVKIESVVSRKLENGVGYVRITEFSSKTTEDLKKVMSSFAKDSVTSLVLDLRNNPGGLLSSAIEIASLFLGDGKLIVFTRGRRLDSRQEFTAGFKAPYANLPLVILINGGSASASEIVAGAMQDHRRAVVVGERSYGKASVQSVIPLSDGSGLRLTVAHYYTPLGRSIHRDEKTHTGGIVPDFVVPITPDTEAKLYEQWEMIYAKDKKPTSAVKTEDMVRDEQLDRAIELLHAREVLGALKTDVKTSTSTLIK